MRILKELLSFPPEKSHKGPSESPTLKKSIINKKQNPTHKYHFLSLLLRNRLLAFQGYVVDVSLNEDSVHQAGQKIQITNERLQETATYHRLCRSTVLGGNSWGRNEPVNNLILMVT